jgi:hypothetical protein
VPDGVVDEVRGRTNELDAIRDDRKGVVVRQQLEHHVLHGGLGPQPVDEVVQDLGQVELLEVQRLIQILEPRVVEQVVDEPVEGPCLLARDGQIAGALLRCLGETGLEAFEVAAQ